MNRLYILCLSLVFVMQVHARIESVSQLVAYADTLPEHPIVDVSDWERPDFTSFFITQRPNFFHRVKNFFGLGQDFINQHLLKKILSKVTAARQKKGMQGDFVQKVIFPNEGRLILFGDIQGAFHSLVRSLAYLTSTDVISEKFIIEESSYFVFNGNLINGSPYNLETLHLIMVLMEKNPERVIYIAGDRERMYDSQSQLCRQIELQMDAEREDLCASIKNFFETLPQALYVKRNEGASLKIASLSSGIFQDDQLGGFLDKDDRRTILNAQDYQKRSGPSGGSIGAQIRAHDYSRTNGLKRYVEKPIAWTVFSAPNGANRRLHAFFKDAFVIIDTAIHFHDWTITLYAHDLEEKDNFDMIGTYNLASGLYVAGKSIDFYDTPYIQKFENDLEEKKNELAHLKKFCKESANAQGAKAAVEKQTLLVGTSLDLSKSSKRVGNKINETLQALFDRKNKTGGVRGVTFQNIVLDDAYTPSIARQNFLKFFRELNVHTLLASYGTATLQESLDLVNDDQMAIFFPVGTDSSVFRKEALKNVVNLTASYVEQGKALIEYIFRFKKPQKIVLFYQNDDFGKDGLAGAKQALSKYTGHAYVEISYERNQVDFATQIKRIEQERPDAIGFFCVPLAAADLLKGLGADALANKTLFGVSDVRDEDVLQFIHEKKLSLIYANSLPNYESKDLPIAKEYQSFAQEHNIVPSAVSFETYVATELFFRLIEDVTGEVTNEKILAVAQKIKDFDFKGLRLDFDPKTRVLLDSVWIGTQTNASWERVGLREVIHSAHSSHDGLPSTEKNTNVVLSFATSLDLSKSLKKPNEIVKSTLTQLFEEKNKEGGVNGVVVRDVFFDDGYVPSVAKQNYIRMLNDLQIDMVFASRGTPTTQELLEFLKDGRMALFFPIGTGSRIFRDVSLKNSIGLTASYYEQGKAVMKTVLAQLKSPKVAIFYQDDNFGADVLEGAKDVLKKAGVTDFIEVPYKRGQIEFEKQASLIKKENPNAIGLFSTTLSAIELIKAMGASALRDKVFFGSEVLREQEFLKFMQDKGLSFVFASSLPDPASKDLLIAQEYSEFVKRYNLEFDSFGFEAYVAAHILLNLIASVDLPITKEKLIAAAEKINNVDFKGLQLSFNPKTRVLLNAMWVGKNTGEPWIKLALEDDQVVNEQPQPYATAKVPLQKESKDAQESIVLQDNTLILGCSLDVSKGLQAMTTPLKEGMDAAVQEINAKGGIKGIKLKIIYLDDGYIPEMARKNVETFLKDYNTNLFIASVGTPTLEAYLDMVKAGKIAIFFPFTGASLFRSEAYQDLLFFAPSYDETTVAATRYILKNNKRKRWALLYQDDSFGKPPKDAVKKVLEKISTEEILEVPFERNNVNFVEQIKQIKLFNPDIIAFLSPAIAAQNFITAMGVSALSGKTMYGLYWLTGNKLQAFLKEKGLKVIMPSPVPDPLKSEMMIVKKFRKALQHEAAISDPNALEGYINVRIFADLLKRIEGPLNAEKIMQAAAAIKDYNFEGLMLDFEPKKRVLSHHMWLDLADGKEWKYIDLRKEDPYE